MGISAVLGWTVILSLAVKLPVATVADADVRDVAVQWTSSSQET
jgi:hypothetical protein